MSRLKGQHATLSQRMRDAGDAPARAFAEQVQSLYRGYQSQALTNGRLWHDNMALRALLKEKELGDVQGETDHGA